MPGSSSSSRNRHAATVGEDLQDGYKLIDAWCVNLGGLDVEPEAMSRIKAADTGELVGELDGDTVTFDVDPDTLYECVFVNTLVPEDSVGGETETPANTLHTHRLPRWPELRPG